jgi:hypothetical protein
MDNAPDEWRKKERSYSYSSHSKLLNHCHQMLRSLSNHSSHRNNHDCNASANELATTTDRRRSIFGNHQSIKKTLSLIFHRGDSAASNHTDNNEMHEFIRCTSSEENLNTMQRLASNISQNPIIDQKPVSLHDTSTTTVHHKIFRWKNKFKCRSAHTNHDREKNQGYLVVVNPDIEPVLLPTENLDHQQTQHAEPCVQINEISFDLNQIQYSSVTPIVPNSSPSQETSLGLYLPSYNIHLRHELDMQSTRSSIECGVPQGDFMNIEDTQVSCVIPVASPSSTNSSGHKYSGMDRSLLNDNDYVEAQELDLDCLINFEFDLYKERSYLEMDLEEEENFSRLYEATLKENLQLKEDLKALQEEHDSRYLPWSCELCTYINQPFIETKRNVCDICESPSPLKRATLLQ